MNSYGYVYMYVVYMYSYMLLYVIVLYVNETKRAKHAVLYIHTCTLYMYRNRFCKRPEVKVVGGRLQVHGRLLQWLRYMYVSGYLVPVFSQSITAA